MPLVTAGFEVVWCGAMRTELLPPRAEHADVRLSIMPSVSEYDERRAQRFAASRATRRETRHKLMASCLADRLARRQTRAT